jgi:hypothetical protein
VAAGRSVDPGRWRAEFHELMGRVADRFMLVEPRRTARTFVRGLLAPIERKNCWWLAEHAGLEGPQAMQRLLRTARLDADGLRDDVRAHVAGIWVIARPPTPPARSPASCTGHDGADTINNSPGNPLPAKTRSH